MEVIHGCRLLTDGKKHFAALGTFDGVHVGHQKIIRSMVSDAKAAEGKSLVITFSNHPRNFLKPERPIKLLTSPEAKEALIRELDVDLLALLKFDRRLADLDPLSFVRDILVSCFRVSRVYVGYNYTFGFKGNGSPELLRQLGENFGFEVFVMPPICLNQDPISSSAIRKLLAAGDVELASKYLGRWPEFCGQVVHGKGMGRGLGYPTANLLIGSEMQLPLPGVYFGRGQVDGRSHDAVVNIGSKPTLGGTDLSFEVHLLDFSGNLYGKYLTVCLKKRLRDEKRFDSVEELSRQIARDIESVSALRQS